MNYYANIQFSSHICRIVAMIFVAWISIPLLHADDTYFVRGIVRDNKTNEPLPYASVVVPEHGTGTVADDNGIFELPVPDSAKELHFTYMGYEKLILPIKKNSMNTYVVYMNLSNTVLDELVVRKSKYSKKNNPAVDFLNLIKKQSHYTSPKRHDFYSYDKYERFTVGLNDFRVEDSKFWSNKIPSIEQHIDTSDVSGKTFLSLIVKEKSSKIYNRKIPKDYREIVKGLRSEGIDGFIDQSSMRALFEDVMREIDLYQNDITLVHNRFVSPLSRIAADFYKFYLTDTVTIDDERCIVLSFYPHNRATFGFIGNLYVPANDTTMFIRKVEMRIPSEINLNFVDKLYISQSFKRAPDGTRLITEDQLTMEMSLTGHEDGFFLRRKSLYANHNFDAFSDTVFNGAGQVVEQKEASKRDDVFWEKARLDTVSNAELNTAKLVDKLRSIPIYYYGEKALKLMFTGYVGTSKNRSKFDIGPLNSIVSFNSTEGSRFRFGGMTTANLSKRWFSRVYGAYGVRDHRWKYGFELEHSFIDKEYHSREFPVRSLRFSSSYDIDHPGEHYPFTSADNIILSLKRGSDDRLLYQWVNKLQFTFESESNFSVGATVSNTRRDAAPSMPFIDGYGNNIESFSENMLEVVFRYAPGEKFFQTRTYRITINEDAPAISIRQRYAPKNFLGTRYGINSTEINIQSRIWLSAFGHLDIYLSGGHVWNSTSFLGLNSPNVNRSYIVQPLSFALMNPMEFVSSTYGSFDLAYWANGAILNYIPYIKKLKLREIFCFRGYWGHLNHSNDPAYNPEFLQFPTGVGQTKLDKGPYMEVSVGLENILRVLRIDYVWRLNYRDVPYEIDRHGLRLAMNISF